MMTTAICCITRYYDHVTRTWYIGIMYALKSLAVTANPSGLPSIGDRNQNIVRRYRVCAEIAGLTSRPSRLPGIGDLCTVLE